MPITWGGLKSTNPPFTPLASYHLNAPISVLASGRKRKVTLLIFDLPQIIGLATTSLDLKLSSKTWSSLTLMAWFFPFFPFLHEKAFFDLASCYLINNLSQWTIFLFSNFSIGGFSQSHRQRIIEAIIHVSNMDSMIRQTSFCLFQCTKLWVKQRKFLQSSLSSTWLQRTTTNWRQLARTWRWRIL